MIWNDYFDFSRIEFHLNNIFLACEEGPGICAHLLTLFSILIIITTLPFSLLCVIKVVQVDYVLCFILPLIQPFMNK